MSLTGRVVALNLAGLAAYGIILNSSAIGNLRLLPISLLLIFGILVAVFGMVFNVGAFAAQQHLLATELSLKSFINNRVGEGVASDAAYREIMNVSVSNKISKLTAAFLLVCGLIWIALGGTIIYFGSCVDRA